MEIKITREEMRRILQALSLRQAMHKDKLSSTMLGRLLDEYKKQAPYDFKKGEL